MIKIVLEIVVPAIGTLIGISLVKKTTELIESPKLPKAMPRIKGLELPKGKRFTDKFEGRRLGIEEPIGEGLIPSVSSRDVRRIRPR